MNKYVDDQFILASIVSSIVFALISYLFLGDVLGRIMVFFFSVGMTTLCNVGYRMLCPKTEEKVQ